MYQLGLIGYPIQHSLSPWIHEQFMQRTNVQGKYSIIEIPTDQSFENEMNKLKQSDLDGFNITAPYKEKILPYIDVLDPQAEKIGAVNTVLCKDGKWYGYNTDGAGYVRSLVSKYKELAESKDIPILLLGAGGACKGIYYALKHQGYSNITIANRTIEKAKAIIGKDDTNMMTIEEAEKNVGSFSLLIQTSSVGMKPNIEASIISLNGLQEKTIISDIVYQPLETKFIQEGKQAGANVHYGHTMLLYQAQYAFEIWTGKTPSMEDLDEQLQTILEG